MSSKYSAYEARYVYGLFLLQEKREEDAYHVFADIVSESKHLSPVEKRYYRKWLLKAKEELKKMAALTN